ncbi:MAG: DUF5343 domain-containing protein [Actinobacteria bacterium]|nr:DUF5343 domain-containing protein [Actinomycetota bacterium]
MADVPYSPNPAGITRFLQHIRTAGKPTKVTVKYLKSTGFKSSNDSYLIRILKALGFLDANGAPTDLWVRYRDKDKGGAVLASAIKSAYSELFAVYPDAYRKDDEALRNFVSTHTDYAEKTIMLAVRTFKTLCKAATFDEVGSPAEDEEHESDEKPLSPSHGKADAQKPQVRAPSININIQLQLPPSDDGKVYDKFFEAMKKHLFADEPEN